MEEHGAAPNASLASTEPSAPEPVSDPSTPTDALTNDAASCKRVRELALRQLNRFMSYESQVLKGEKTEAIHDMRVASRRLQQLLDLLYIDLRPPEVRKSRRQIRRCRRALGDVRNCDVLLQIVGYSLGRKRATRRDAWTAVQHYLLMRRSEAYLRALRKLGKINLTDFYVSLKTFLHQGGAADHAPGHHGDGAGAVQRNFASDLSKALESTWSRFESQIERSRRSSRPEIIHAARIATKRLRYLLEVFHEFGVHGSDEAISWLRQLQNHLGDWHDLEVLEQIMIEMVASPQFLRDHLSLAIEVEKLIVRNRANKFKLEERYSRLFRDSDELDRLKEWVSSLLVAPAALAGS